MSTKQLSKLQQNLLDKKQRNHVIISAYLTLGFPDLETSIQAMIETANAGADIIEIGIPFSDPMADGPTIQHTNQVALNHGFNVHDLEYAIRKIRETVDVNIVIMTYANIILQYPLDEFREICQINDIEGVIIPDLPLEHAELMKGLNPIYLIAPNSSDERIKKIANHSNGFLYILSKLGITGGKYNGDERLGLIYKMLNREFPDLPKLQGFGIDSEESVKDAIASGADGVIIGSKLLRLLEQGNIDAVVEFIKNLRMINK